MTEKNKELTIYDVYPDKARYAEGEQAAIIAEIANSGETGHRIDLFLTASVLNEIRANQTETAYIGPKAHAVVRFSLTPRDEAWPAYGVDIGLYADMELQDELSTAFDIATPENDVVRYGFISEFYRQDEGDSDDVRQMSKYHINTAQFYDWMYRHDDLIPKTDIFTDALNRELSVKVIREKIKYCHEYGMKTMAYGAIYGASEAFFESHRDWALYRNDGGAQSFGNWLYIMNTAPDSPWTAHIIDEFKKALTVMDFDGIHMDTYGWPKSAYSMLNGKPKLEQLKDHFPTFVEKVHDELGKIDEHVALTFNAVSNWPIEALAGQPLDALYIEVWDPYERYCHLYQLISRARELGRKQVVLAAYLKPFSKEGSAENEYDRKESEPFNEQYARNSFILCSAVIFASGGYHFVLGENNGILTNNYYVRYGAVEKDFEPVVRGYYDFIVRYGFLLFSHELSDLSMTHANGINDEFVFSGTTFSSYGEPGKVWTIVKEMPGYKVINLINLCGIESDVWNEGKKSRPERRKDLAVRAQINEKVKGVYLASPDSCGGKSVELRFETVEDNFRGSYTTFTIPELDVWDLVYICVEA